MKRIVMASLGVLFSIFSMAQQFIHLRIKALPAFHPAGSSIYVAGSFNGWNPQDGNFKFEKDDTGAYLLNLNLEKGTYEYKLTRGGWDKVECKKQGAGVQNRLLKVEENSTIELSVEEWADRFPQASKRSTASKNVLVIDTAFLIPQLNRTRKVWVYLPDCYESCLKRYPVLYMHDGQNVFDDATSYSGEWGVDEYLDSLGMDANECIVVAIDNGGVKRLNEYCPYDFNLPGINVSNTSNKGEGNAYVDFIVKTLKPFIDRRYRTVKNKANTAIAGSSMGGLISFYALLKYPKVFGAAGVFSPAFWIAPRIFGDIKTRGRRVNSKIYFFAGKLEGERTVSDMLRVYEAMSKVSKSKMQAVIRDDGRHNEATWRREFPLFYKWINEEK